MATWRQGSILSAPILSAIPRSTRPLSVSHQRSWRRYRRKSSGLRFQALPSRNLFRARTQEPVAPEMLSHVAAAMALIKAFRMHGHLAARLDPLGTDPIGDPALDPASLGLTPEVMASIPSKVLRIAVPGATLAESLPS